LPIFGEKNGVFLKNQCYDQIFAKGSSSLSKKANIFAKFFVENILKIITSVPGSHLCMAWRRRGVVVKCKGFESPHRAKELGVLVTMHFHFDVRIGVNFYIHAGLV
jgi:hypothetical protein